MKRCWEDAGETVKKAKQLLGSTERVAGGVDDKVVKGKDYGHS